MLIYLEKKKKKKKNEESQLPPASRELCIYLVNKALKLSGKLEFMNKKQLLVYSREGGEHFKEVFPPRILRIRLVVLPSSVSPTGKKNIYRCLHRILKKKIKSKLKVTIKG